MTVITPSRHRPRRAFGADARPQSAFTLAELLVSSGILALIGVVLVGLLKGGLDLWHRGESNRDLFERAAVVFDVLARDLATAAVDRGEAPPLPLYRALPETVSGKTLAGEKGLPGRPGFFCGRDRHGRPVLRFTRLRRPGEPAAPAPVPASAPTEDAPAPAGPVAPPDAREAAAALAALGGGVRDYMEILYALDPDPEGDRWYRAYLPGPVVGPEPFDEELLASPAFFGAAGELVARGVVWVGYAFWAPGTTTWDLGVPPRASGVRGTGDAGPDPRWDSTRALDRDFALFLKTIPRVPPLADVLPVSVRVTVTVEADPGRARPVTLGAALTAADNERALVSSSAELPDAPAALLVEREWIAYTEKGDGWIKIGTRGARGTAPAAHESGARVRFGTTFERTVAIPAGSGGVVER